MLSINDYEILMNLITAKDFAHPIWDEIDVNDPISEKFDNIMDHCMDYGLEVDDYIFIITKEGSAIGFAQYEPPTNGTAKDFMFPITPSLMISNDTSLVDTVRIFANDSLWNIWFQEAGMGGVNKCPLGKRLLFVLTGNRITHVVRYEHILGLPLRLILFSLLISMESKIMTILQQRPKASLSFLSAKRLNKAMNICAFRNAKKENDGSYHHREILISTTFIDRCEMLIKSNKGLISLPFSDSSEARKFFNQLEKLRNDIAHGRYNEEIAQDPRFLDQILNSLNNLLKALDKPLNENIR